MRIIDKNKDYYDYLSHIYGQDNSILFDRRGSILITDNDLTYKSNLIHLSKIKNRYFSHEKYDHYFLLEVGNKQYTFEISNIILNDFYLNEIKSADFNLIKKEENENKFGFPISIVRLEKTLNWLSIKENSEFRKVGEIIKLPILAGTFITSFITPDEIWREINTYISSLKNDKDSMIVPNDEKIINHGFDKKDSFRK